MQEPIELPTVQPVRPPRADAARNREAILCAARRLLRERGAEAITMGLLADEAGVGKGTLFRRFGDRAGLFHALLDDSERALQEGFLRGPAPLGPGAEPCERLMAFGEALLKLTAERGEVLLAAVPPGPDALYASPVYAAYRAHIRSLLELLEVRPSGYVADVLLAALSPALVLRQLAEGLSLEQLTRAWSALASAVGGVG